MSVKRFWVAGLGLAVVLASAIASAQVAAPAHSAVTPEPRQDEWWQKRHQSMNERVAKGNVDLLLIGDSITHGWEGAGKGVWEEFYGKRNAVNLGIGGDRTQHVLWRLQNGNIDGISPKLAVIMIGTNNSGSNKPEEIADGIVAIVDLLREKLPEMKILVLGIFPRGPNADDPLRKVNIATNGIVAERVKDKPNVTYLDFGQKFLAADGTLSRDVMPDLLHLNDQSYRTWAESIEPIVAEAVGAK